MILVPIEGAYATSRSLWLWFCLAPFQRYGDLLAKMPIFPTPLSFGALAPYVSLGISRRS